MVSVKHYSSVAPFSPSCAAVASSATPAEEVVDNGSRGPELDALGPVLDADGLEVGRSRPELDPSRPEKASDAELGCGSTRPAHPGGAQDLRFFVRVDLERVLFGRLVVGGVFVGVYCLYFLVYTIL